MKKISLFRILATILLIGAAIGSADAQRRFNAEAPPPAEGTNLLGELNLTPEQIRLLSNIHRRRQGALIDARKRLQAANRALDEAVYADEFDEAQIQTRLREAQAAQAEMLQTRIATETAIRQILTPAQLARFRELRAETAAGTRNRQIRNRNPRRRLPLRRLGNRRPVQ